MSDEPRPPPRPAPTLADLLARAASRCREVRCRRLGTCQRLSECASGTYEPPEIADLVTPRADGGADIEIDHPRGPMRWQLIGDRAAQLRDALDRAIGAQGSRLVQAVELARGGCYQVVGDVVVISARDLAGVLRGEVHGWPGDDRWAAVIEAAGGVR